MGTSQYLELFYVDATKNQIESNELFNVLEQDQEQCDNLLVSGNMLLIASNPKQKELEITLRN